MSELEVRLSSRRGALVLDAGFTAAAGEVTALSGPSGAGKSTLLRAIAGLERLDGAVRLGGETWQGEGARFRPPHRREVGFVLQHAALLPHLSVRGNLEYGRRRSGASTADLEAAVARLRLEPLLDRAPDRLSGGERQRAAVARALVTRPKLLLLDEPLSGLDVASKAALLPELRAVFAALSAPVLYVSHDPAEVTRVADRVLSLESGRIVERPAPAGDPLAARSPAEIAALARAALSAGLAPEGLSPPPG